MRTLFEDNSTSSKKWEKVAKALEGYEDENITVVDMMQTYVTSKDTGTGQNICETTACLAGHYMLACIDNYDELPVNDDRLVLHKKGGTALTFSNGVAFMVKDLGFRDRSHLEEFLECHPEIWGNRYGDRIFNCDVAFLGDDPSIVEEETFGLKTVVNHFYEVAERLKELEKEAA